VFLKGAAAWGIRSLPRPAGLNAMLISVHDLRVTYRTGAGLLTVLDIPCWEVKEREQVAISGPSGSGKSTLLHVLAGLLRPMHGFASVCGSELTRLTEVQRDRFRANHIGYVYQNFNLLQGYTATENVMMGMTFSRRKPDRRRAVSLLEEMGLFHRKNHYPAQLSIGEQQRVAIARALIKEPDLILADEPTGSLDPAHTAEVLSLLHGACEERGCSLILVSHDREVVSFFKRQTDFTSLNRALVTKAGEA
jgi:putative ABC transport system ATP-binding protein